MGGKVSEKVVSAFSRHQFFFFFALFSLHSLSSKPTHTHSLSFQPLPEHGVYTVFVELGNTKIELLHPYGENSPIQGFLNKNKSGGIHHICIEVDDVTKAVNDLMAKGIKALNPIPKIGAHGKPVVFLHPKDCHGTLVELEQI